VSAATPLVTAVLVTRDRPEFLRIALRCYAEQTWPNRELVVVDDGDRFPADAAAVAAVGGRIVRMATGTTLGEKLNEGCSAARGVIVQKWDDDDFYAAHYMQTLVRAILDSWQTACQPSIAFLIPFKFFSIPQWEFRNSTQSDAAGGSLTFPRSTWETNPFAHIFSQEDFWFLMNGLNAGIKWIPVRNEDAFYNIRHGSGLGHQSHLWTRQWDGKQMDAHMSALQPAGLDPSTVFPAWALETYTDMHHRLRAVAAGK
jgi:glycosyltransferase involved in cell wall biosynthesis